MRARMQQNRAMSACWSASPKEECKVCWCRSRRRNQALLIVCCYPSPQAPPHPFTTPFPCEKVHSMARKSAGNPRVQQHAQQAAVRRAPRPARQAEEQRRASGSLAGAVASVLRIAHESLTPELRPTPKASATRPRAPGRRAALQP